MAIKDIFDTGRCRLQVTTDFKVSQRVRDFVSSSHPPALVSQFAKGLTATSVTVDGIAYTQVSSSGALAAGTWWWDTSNSNVDDLYVQALTVQDDDEFEQFGSSPTESQLTVGSVGVSIPGDADGYSTYTSVYALTQGYSPDDFGGGLSAQDVRNFWVYLTLQGFLHYVADNSINVYGYYEPYFVQGAVEGNRSIVDGYLSQYGTGSTPIYNYTDFATYTSNADSVSVLGSGSGTGWICAIRYVSSVSGGSSAITPATEPFIDGGTGEENYSTFLKSGSTTHDLRNGITRVEFQLSMAKHADVDSEQYYEPRIISAPAIEKRIEPLFGKPIHIGSGQLVLNNADGFFDLLRDFNWAGNTCDITARAALPHEEFTDANSQAIGRYLMTDATFDRDSVRVTLKEPTVFFDAGFPLRFFDDLENIELTEETRGKHVPYIFGRAFNVPCYMINNQLKEFQVADHAVHSVANVRRVVDGVETESRITTKVYESGRFRLDDWEEGQEVFADVNGWSVGGVLQNNPSDIVREILRLMGFSFSTSSLDDAKTYYKVTDNGFPFLKVDKEVGLYISEPDDVGSIFSTINLAAQSFFRFNTSQQIEYHAWYPKRRTTITETIEDYELIDWRETSSERDIVSRIHAKYQEQEEGNGGGIIAVQGDALERYNLGGDRIKVLSSRAAQIERARSFAQKILTIRGQEQRVYTVKMVFRPITFLPGDQVRLKISRWDFNEIVEIISVRSDLMSGSCEITFSNRRNWRDTSGWWADNSATGYDLLYTDEVKQDLYEEIGMWTDDQGFLDDQDQDSYNRTRYL